MNVCLTIAGFDTSSGAGASADLMVFAAHGLYGTACLTALTVQSTVGVARWEPVSAKTIQETLACLHEDLPAKGIKIGMLGSGGAVRAVVDFLSGLSDRERIPIVLDPVVHSSSGRELLDEEGRKALPDLLKLVSWVTPNTPEIASITAQQVFDGEDLSCAAAALQAEYPHLNVVATGGHLQSPDDLLRVAGGQETWFRGERINSSSTHGTGCAFSSALLSQLVLGKSPGEAVRAAKAYVAEAIRSAPVGVGTGHGPLNHLWPLNSE